MTANQSQWLAADILVQYLRVMPTPLADLHPLAAEAEVLNRRNWLANAGHRWSAMMVAEHFQRTVDPVQHARELADHGLNRVLPAKLISYFDAIGEHSDLVSHLYPTNHRPHRSAKWDYLVVLLVFRVAIGQREYSKKHSAKLIEAIAEHLELNDPEAVWDGMGRLALCAIGDGRKKPLGRVSIHDFGQALISGDAECFSVLFELIKGNDPTAKALEPLISLFADAFLKQYSSTKNTAPNSEM